MLEEESKYATKKLLLIGLPSFILALVISFTFHQYAHIIVSKMVCGTEQQNNIQEVIQGKLHDGVDVCPLASFAGPSSTFILALASFAIFMRRPKNLFFASMAFINASARIPETVTVFLQMILNTKVRLVADESSSIALLRLHDPTIAIVILFFFSLAIISLTITVLHDIKMIRWKWPIAILLFLSMGPLETMLWKVIGPFLY